MSSHLNKDEMPLILMDFLVYYVCTHVKNIGLWCFDMHGSERELQISGAYFSPVQVADFAKVKISSLTAWIKTKPNETP